MVLGNMIGGFITILVGTTLIPVVADQVAIATLGADQNASTPTNLTGTTSATLLDLATLFFALGVMATGISLGVASLKQSGLI